MGPKRSHFFIYYSFPTLQRKPKVRETPFLPPLCTIVWPKAVYLSSLNRLCTPAPYDTYGLMLISGSLTSFAVTLDLSSIFQVISIAR